jgi:hypothetical protein
MAPRRDVREINGVTHYLWRAVDHEGEVLESFATKERDMAAALKFMKKLMKRHGTAKKITTDGLRSYKAAMKRLGNTHKRHCQNKILYLLTQRPRTSAVVDSIGYFPGWSHRSVALKAAILICSDNAAARLGRARSRPAEGGAQRQPGLGFHSAVRGDRDSRLRS